MARTIGILVTNTDDSEFAHRHPLDGEKYSKLLHSVRPAWHVVAYQVKDGVFPQSVAACDGYVITGSPASVNGPEAWVTDLMTFIRSLAAAGVPTVGCCFGHQAIAKAMGGTVSKHPGGWGFGLSPTRFTRHMDWMEPAAETLMLYAAHNEQVTQLPEGAECLGGSDFCPIGAFRMGKVFFTTQYHPEMEHGFVTELIEEFADYVGPDVAARARAQIKTPAQSAIFAEWMARFLEMPRS